MTAIHHHDSAPRVLVTLTTAASDGRETGNVTATDNHPFWSVNRQKWAPAGELVEGDLLCTPEGEQATLLSTHRSIQHQPVYNL